MVLNCNKTSNYIYTSILNAQLNGLVYRGQTSPAMLHSCKTRGLFSRIWQSLSMLLNICVNVFCEFALYSTEYKASNLPSVQVFCVVLDI